MPLRLLITKELFQEVQSIVSGLPAIYSSTVYYKHGHGFTYEEISKIMSVSKDVVSQRLYRARKMLKERKNISWR